MRSTPPHIALAEVGKRYKTTPVLSALSLSVEPGAFVAITGASGAGKTTLLAVLGLLETWSGGAYRLGGRDVAELGDEERSLLRNRTFGFVFQQFHLLPDLCAWENVARPLVYARVPQRERRERALALLRQFGLEDRALHRPAQLSGGEQQRVAIARALVNDPAVILADEPTGNLPKAQWQPVLETLAQLNEMGKTVILTTHHPDVPAFAREIYDLHAGALSRRTPSIRPRQTGSAPMQPTLQLELLGQASVTYGGVPLVLTPRQQDLLAILARYPQGLSGEALLLCAYGESGNLGTLKAALSKLRRYVPIGSRPYRLEPPTEADFLRLEALLRQGELAEAVVLYKGPLLPHATAPEIVGLRERLEETLRRAVLASNDADTILALAKRLQDDLELWETAARLLSVDDPQQGMAQARALEIKRDWKLTDPS